MLKIEVTKKFRKQVSALKRNQRNQLAERLRLFANNPSAKKLRTHPLKGNLLGIYSFSITGDLRVHFEWKDKKRTQVLLISIGTHSQLY